MKAGGFMNPMVFSSAHAKRMSRQTMNALVSKVMVHERQAVAIAPRARKTITQQIEIHFKFVGNLEKLSA